MAAADRRRPAGVTRETSNTGDGSTRRKTTGPAPAVSDWLRNAQPKPARTSSTAVGTSETSTAISRRTPACSNARSTIARVPQPTGKSTNRIPFSSASLTRSRPASGWSSGQASCSGSDASGRTESPLGYGPGSAVKARSRRPSSTPATSSTEPPTAVDGTIWTSGRSRWYRVSAEARSISRSEFMMPIRTVPRTPPCTAATASRPASTAASALRASASSARPASVSRTRWVVRSSSRAPSSRSSARTETDSVD